MMEDKVDINIVTEILIWYLLCCIQFYYVKIKAFPFYLNRKGELMQESSLCAEITINE